MARIRSQIYDVAAKAGVSIATVSRVINELGKVKPETAAAVKQAMSDLNYVPNEMARSLATNSTGMIGFYMTSSTLSIFDNKYALELLRGIESVILESPYSIVIISDKEEESNDFVPKYLKFARKKRIDGLILNGIDQSEGYYPQFRSLLDEGFPIAYFGKRSSRQGFNVYAQFEEYIYRMLSVFKEKGHRQILAVTLDAAIHGHRFEDVVARFRSDNPDGPDIVVFKTTTGNDKSAMIAKLEDEVLGNDCTGLFMEPISLMPTVLGYLSSKGIRVPQDVSIISVEHQKGDGAAFYPKINCFFVPAFEMGIAAARFMMAALEKKKLDHDATIFSPDYIERESLRDAPKDHHRRE